ncbi:MAG: hypothetical protein IKI88_08195 [Anaerotignum sp.]|nr:hypothetical protein [Anaerotignum sp.]
MEAKTAAEQKKSPLRIYCKSCGAEAGFDIIRQAYRCSYCGGLTGIQEAKKEVSEWRRLQKENTVARSGGQEMEEHSCPSCGGHFVFRQGEATETCVFCESKLLRAEFTESEQLPELVIPFFLTQEEARKRTLEWGEAHEKTPEGKAVLKNIDKFRGCYLPYHLVRGPVRAEVNRHGNERQYHCAGYLEGVAVNASKQLDNLLLNEIEPFDWSAADAFSYGYIAGQAVKLSDISDAEIDERVREEAASAFLPDVEKTMQSDGVQINVETGDMSAIPALLPIYFIQSGKLTAVMNGQTGRIAVSKERKKITYPWVIEPMIYTVLLTLLLSLLVGFRPEGIFYGSILFGCIVFSVMGDGRKSLIRRIIAKSETARANREQGELKIEEGRDILKNPYDTMPIFYEPDDKGEEVPVQIRFYSFFRGLTVLTNGLITIFLPAMIAAVIRLIRMGKDESFMAGFHPGYGAPWYALAAFLVFVYFLKMLRKDIYDSPILYEILPDGRKRRIGRHFDRKLGILSMFKIREKTDDGKKVTVFWLLTHMGGAGIFLIVSLSVLLFGSVAAIVSLS